MKVIEVAVAIIVADNQQVLLTQREAHKHQGGRWEFPGGKLEMGETAEQALQREIAEEVGLILEQPRAFKRFSYRYDDREVNLHFFLCREFSGEAQGLEGQALCWVPLNDLLNIDFPDANKTVIEDLIRTI